MSDDPKPSEPSVVATSSEPKRSEPSVVATSTEPTTFGTVDRNAPITRDDFERALRALHLGDLEARDMLLRLAAQVVALTEEVASRDTSDTSNTSGTSVTDRVNAAVPEILERIRAADARSTPRVQLDTYLENKYEIATDDPPPCAELIPICGARCCRFNFPLSTADLDEGVIRWDYGRPYLIRQRASDGFCVHNDPTTHFCTVHTHRPATCRRYHCRDDKRIWIDYDKRIPAAPDAIGLPPALDRFDLAERAKRYAAVEAIEQNAVTHVYPEDEPVVGPALTPRARRSSPDER
jgi:Fe-S-cluster containining protein